VRKQNVLNLIHKDIANNPKITWHIQNHSFLEITYNFATFEHRENQIADEEIKIAP
jgi:hypothetical protein